MPGLRLEYDWLYGSLGIALFVVGFIKQRKLKAQATVEVPAVKA